MTNVIGPIPKDIWITMREIKGSLNYMKAANDNNTDWSNAIDREGRLYKDYLGDVKKSVA